MSSSFIDMGNAPDEMFSLRWNSHGKVLIESTANLLYNSKLHDVTLACEGKTIRCHRFILAMFSPCLARMLEEHPTSDPVIYLGNGIKFNILRTLVSYMYSGEVEVGHSGLQELLKAAEDLNIRGLSTSISKPKRRVDGEELMVNDDQGNFLGIDLTRNTGVAGFSFNNALARTPSPSRSDEEQENCSQNMVIGDGEAKDGDGHGQETGAEESGATGTGDSIDYEEETRNESIPEENDDNPPGTSNGEANELVWKPLGEDSKGGTENVPTTSRRKRKAVLKTLQKAKKSSSKVDEKAEKKKAKKKRTVKVADQTSYYGGLMKEALDGVSGGEKVSKVASQLGIPVSTLCKYVKNPEKLRTSRVYAYVQ